MCKATEGDITKALVAADEHFADREQQDFDQEFENGKTVPIMFQVVGSRWDYGPPAMYVTDLAVVEKLKAQWLKMHPNSGKVLPPQDKGTLGWQVNFQFETENRKFNFHVAVPKPA
jgi:hypothetical protein